MDKLSFKKNSMSLGLVVSEEKSLMRTSTPQSDDIKTISVYVSLIFFSVLLFISLIIFKYYAIIEKRQNQIIIHYFQILCI